MKLRINLNSPIFISGHPRSGTNFVMRLLDSSNNLICPPGEGKVNILRRHMHKNKYLIDDIELNISNREKNLIFKNLKPNINNLPEFVNEIYKCFFIYKYKEIFSDKYNFYWLEKNHNLEFYFHRSRKLFKNHRFIFISRNIISNWNSWKAYIALNSLESSINNLCFYIICHILNEIDELKSGLKNFNNENEILRNYFISKTKFDSFYKNIKTTDKLFKYDYSYFFKDEFLKMISTSESRFAVNYFLMHQKAKYLNKTFSKEFMIVNYNNLVENTEEEVNKICTFTSINYSEKNLVTTDGLKNWNGNSSFNNINKNLVKDNISTYEIQNINTTINYLGNECLNVK